jgi:hypothetical protein
MAEVVEQISIRPKTLNSNYSTTAWGGGCGGGQWLIPVILSTWETEIGKITV